MTFTEAMEWTSRAFEVAAIVVLVVGFLTGVVKALRARFGDREEESYAVLRRYFGRSILLGLEILVAADLIRTVAVDQTWENVLSPRPDRPDPDLPELLARGGDGRRVAVAPLGAPQVGRRARCAGSAGGRRLGLSARAPALPGYHRGMSDAGGSLKARRVLLVVANREQFPEPAFPVGALYVARAVEAAGGRARVFDAGLYRRPLAALRAELTEWRPDVVGLSLRNADNAAWPYTNTYTEWYARVADTVRAAAPRARASSSAARRSPSSRGRSAAPCSSPTASSATASRRRGGWPAGVAARRHRRGVAGRPRRRRPPRRPRRRVPRRRTVPHRRRADGARLPAPLRLLHLSAARGHTPAPAPARGGRRRDGAPPP